MPMLGWFTGSLVILACRHIYMLGRELKAQGDGGVISCPLSDHLTRHRCIMN